MKKTNKKMVIIIDVDTARIIKVTDEEGRKVEKQKWPKDGIQIGKLVRHIPCGIILYDNSPEDCLIFHHGNCDTYTIGC